MTGHDPYVTVVLPVYNGESFIGEALDSILAQDGLLEVIVSDDNSKDRSVAIIESRADNRIRILKNSKNKGIFGNINRCLEEVRGEFVQLFSQDDVMMPGFVSAQMGALEGHSSAGMVYNRPKWITKGGQLLESVETDDTPDIIDWPTYLWIASHFGALPASISSVMIRKNAIDRVGLFDNGYAVAGDLEFYNRLAEAFDIIYLKDSLHLVRSHDGMASNPLRAGPRYLEEEARLERWFSSRWSKNDWHKIRDFRAATRGRSHLGWVRRMASSGKWLEAARAAVRVHQLYPLHIAMWSWILSRRPGMKPQVPPPSGEPQ